MEKVINMLFEIEEKANHIIERANEEKTSLHDALEKKLIQMEQKIAKENYNKIHLLQSQIDLEFKKEEQLLIQHSEKQLIEIEAQFIKNHDVYVHNIFQRMINM